MITPRKQPIRSLPTGVPGLDTVLGGGLPEYSFNLIAGGPGAGKTTLAQQIMFAHAGEGRRALYFTVLGEPALKMLRHVQQYSFFDGAKVGDSVRFVNLSAEAMEQDLSKLLERIIAEVEAFDPSLVVVDSFRTVTRANVSEVQVQEFVQRLALHLTSWQATTFLVGEYDPTELQSNPIFTVADGIIWMTQCLERNASVRRLQITKLRAAAPLPGLNTFVMSDAGIRVYPRVVSRPTRHAASSTARAATGVSGLDTMMRGGIPAGCTALVAGPSGSGKSVLARQFIAEGAAKGEPGVVAVFEEHPGDFLDRANSFGPPLHDLVKRGLVEILYLRPLDLTVDEALAEMRTMVERIGARRLAIDSLSGFELSLAPSFREDFRESLFRMVTALTGTGVTVLMTTDLVESFTELRFSPYIIEFLADVLILQRYVEVEGRLDRVIAVVKMRNSAHDTNIRPYTIDESGLTVGATTTHFRGVLSGTPVAQPISPATEPGLTPDEMRVLVELRNAGQARASDLGKRSGVRGPLLLRALNRLLALDYASRKRSKGSDVYHAKKV